MRASSECRVPPLIRCILGARYRSYMRLSVVWDPLTPCTARVPSRADVGAGTSTTLLLVHQATRHPRCSRTGLCCASSASSLGMARCVPSPPQYPQGCVAQLCRPLPPPPVTPGLLPSIAVVDPASFLRTLRLLWFSGFAPRSMPLWLALVQVTGGGVELGGVWRGGANGGPGYALPFVQGAEDPAVWELCDNGQGVVYYYNTETGESTYNRYEVG
jgi:hypothetical protein